VIAQSYAINNPDKVNKLVLSDTFGELKTIQEKLLGFSQVIGFRIYKLLRGKMLAKRMASAYKAPFAERAKEYFSQVSLNVDFDQLILARKAINKIDAIGKIDGARIPTLVRGYALDGRTWIGSARYARTASRMIAVFDS